MCVRFGLPFVLHLDRTVAWDLLQKEILEKMKYFLRPTACIQVGLQPAGPACVCPVQDVLRQGACSWDHALGARKPGGQRSGGWLWSDLQD